MGLQLLVYKPSVHKSSDYKSQGRSGKIDCVLFMGYVSAYKPCIIFSSLPNFQTILSNMLASECGDHILIVLTWWICIQFLTDRPQYVLYHYVCSGLSGKDQILGGSSLCPWDLETFWNQSGSRQVPEARHEHLGAFPSVQRQVALSSRPRRTFRLCAATRGPRPFADLQSWSHLPGFSGC